MRPTVFIFCNQPLDLQNLHRLLVNSDHLVETFERSESLIARIDTCAPKCVIIDSTLSGKAGLELQDAIVGRNSELPIIFMSGNADVPTVVSAMKNGAHDFLTKPVDPQDLLAAVASAVRTAEQAEAKRGKVEAARGRWASLSPSERKACRFAAQGLLNKQVAAELGVTVATAHVHRMNGMKKLRIDSVMNLARLLDLVGDAD